MQGCYREIDTSLPKIDDISNDLSTCEAKMKSKLAKIEGKKENWVMLYRKMIDKPEQNRRFLLNILRIADSDDQQ